jgi:hypothetical protein
LWEKVSAKLTDEGFLDEDRIGRRDPSPDTRDKPGRHPLPQGERGSTPTNPNAVILGLVPRTHELDA